ncbi:MAG: two-component regulator propeller domain-containing protein, partial [Opitutaceae bacterium]
MDFVHLANMKSFKLGRRERRLSSVLAWVLFFGVVTTGFSAGDAEMASGSKKGEPYYFDSFGLELGLPQPNVVAALQTSDGYLWVGTEGGLGRFDGVRFVSFIMANTPAFESQSIRCLFEDNEGRLWIGTA